MSALPHVFTVHYTHNTRSFQYKHKNQIKQSLFF